MPVTKEEVLLKMGDRGVVVLNVLSEKDFEKLHIRGSQSLSLLHIRPEEFVKTVEKRYGRDKYFITYCSGLPSGHFREAAELLARNGFKAEGYAGGIREWADSDLPVEGTLAGDD